MANVKVAIRVRPLSKRELDAQAQFIIQINENTTSVTNIKLDGTQEGYGDTRERLKHFVFDYSYWSVDQNSPDYAAQEQIFQDLGTDVLASAFQGYNACVFAYGQTGTGKTYTMMGDTDRLGLIPRISEGLFSRIDDHVGERVTFKTEVSYLEIYNERVRDLLCHPGAKANTYSLKVREHPEKGPYVQDLSRHLVSDYTSLERLIQRGNENRTTAATYIHDLSSRSHAIFTIYFSQAKLEDNLPREIVSKIHLVDLAGSERADPNYHKDRLKEGANINRSLVTLGTVISALAYQQEKGVTSSPWTSENSLLSASTESFGSIGDDLGSSIGKAGKKMAFIPYRDSVLTWLLKDSLGGNAKTIMIAAISPASICYSETINTLRYARRAKRIVNRPKINEDPNVRLIRELRAEIGRLKKLLQNHDMRSSSMSLNEDRNQVITEMLMRNEEKVEQLTRDWSDKWDETQTIIQETRLGIRRPSSVGVIVESQLPHLIGMDDDMLSTGIVIYHLKDGKTIIGTEENEDEPDIVLDGPFMEKEHCVIRNENNTVFLHPINSAACAVNGMDITTPIRLKQGAVILLGKMHMFRFNNPFEAARLRRERSTGSMNGVGLGSTMSLNSDGEGESPPPLIPSPISPKSVLSLSWEWERYQKVEAEKVEEARRQLEELHQQRLLAEEEHQRLQAEMAEKQKAHQEAIERQRALLERLRQEADGAQSVAEQEIQEARRRLAQEIQEAEDLKLKQQQLERQEFAVQTDSMESRETGIQYDVMGQPRDKAKPTTQSVSTTATTLTDQVLIDETRLKELQEKERLFEQLRWRMDHDTMALEMDRVSPIGAQDENVYVSPKASTDDDSSSVATTVKAHPKLGLLKMEEMSEGQTPSTLTPATMTPPCHSPRSGSPTPSNYSTSSMSLPSMSDSSMSMSSTMEHGGQKSKAALTRRRSREASSPTKEKPSPTAEEVTARLYPGSPSSVRKAWQANSKGEKEEEGSVPVPERSKSPTTYKKNGRTYIRKRALHDASDDSPFSSGQLPPVKPKTRPAPSSSSRSEDHGSPANGTRATSPKKERQKQLQPKSPTKERSSVSTLQSDGTTTQTQEQRQSVVTGTTVHREKRIVVKKAQAETDSVSLLLQETGDSSEPLTKPDKKHRPRVFHVEDSVGKILHDSGDQTDSGISVSIETMTTRVEVKADQAQTFPLDRRKVESEDTQTPPSFLEQVSARLEAVQQTKGAFDSQSKADSSSFGSFVGKDRGDILNRRAVSASRASSVAETLSEDWSTVSDSAAIANIKKRWPRRRFIDRPEDVSPITWGPTPYQRPRSAGDERKPRWWSVGGMGGGGGGSDTPLSLSTSDTDSLYSVRSARRYGSADSIAHEAFARSLRGEEGASPSPAPIRRSKSAGAVKTTSSGVSMSALADIRSRSPSSRLLPTPPKRKPPVGGSRTTSPRSPAGTKAATKPKLDISKSATSQEKRLVSPTKPQKSLGAKPKRETSPTKSVERKVSSTKAAKGEMSPTEAAKSPTKTVKRVSSPTKNGSGTKSPTKTTSPTKPLPPTKPTKAVSLLATKSKSQTPKPPITRPKPKLDDLKKKVKSTPRSEPDGKAREDKKVKPPVPKKPTSLSRDSKASVGTTDAAPKVTSPVKRKTPSPVARSPSLTSPTRSSPKSFPSDASTRSDPSVKSKSPSEASSKSDSKGRKSKSPVQKGSTGKPRKITSYVIGPEPNVEKYRPKSKVRAHIKKTLAERAKRGDTPSSQEGSILSGGTSSVSIAMDDVMTEATEESVYSDDSLEGEEGAERPSAPKTTAVHPLPIKERVEASSDNESIYSVDSLMAEGETSPESDSLMVKKVGRKKVSKEPSELEADSLDSADSLEDAWEDGAVAALKKAVDAGDEHAAQRGVNVHIEASAEMQSSMETVSTAVSSDVTSQTTEGGEDASSVIELGEEMMIDADVTSASAAEMEEEKSSVDVPTQEDRVTTEEVPQPAATSPTSLDLKEVPQKPAEDGESPSEKDSLASDSSPDKEARAGVPAVKLSSVDAAGDGDDEAARYSADSLNEADSPTDTESKPVKSEKTDVDQQGRLSKEDQQQHTPSSATGESLDKDLTQEQDTSAPESKKVDSDNDSMHSDDSLADSKEASSLPVSKQQSSRPARKVRYTRKLPSETDTFSDDSLSDRAHRSSPPKIHRRVKQLQDSTESDGVYSVDSLSEEEPKSPRKTPAARRVSSEVGEASMPAAEPIAEEDKEESSRADDQVSEDSLGEEDRTKEKDDDKQQESEVQEEDSVTTVDEKQNQSAEIDQDIPVVQQGETEQETKQETQPEPTSGERPDLDKDWQELKTAKTEREETEETEMITREDELADHRYLLAEANRSSDHEVDSDASNEEKQDRLDSANDDRSPEAPAMQLKDHLAEESQTKHHDNEFSEPDDHISEEPLREVDEQTSADVRDNQLAVESTVPSDKEQSDGSDFDLPSVLHIISDIQAQAVEVSNLLTTEEQKVLPTTVESGQQTTIRPTNKTLTTGPVVVDEVGFEEVQSESADVRTHIDEATSEMHTESATSAVSTSSTTQFLANGERSTKDAESGRHGTDIPDNSGKTVCTTGTQWDKPELSTAAVGTESTGQQDLGINTEDSTHYSDSTTNTEEDVVKYTDTSTGTQLDMPEQVVTTVGTESVGQENFNMNTEDSTQFSDSATHTEVASTYTNETTGMPLVVSEQLPAALDTESTRQQDFSTSTENFNQFSDSTTTTEQSVSEYPDPTSRTKSEQGASAVATITTVQESLVISTEDPIRYSDSTEYHPGASVDTPLDKPDQRATAVSTEIAEEQDTSQYSDSTANTEQHTAEHTQVTNTDDIDIAGSQDLTSSRVLAVGEPTVKSPVQGTTSLSHDKSSTRPPVQDSRPHLFLSSTSSSTEQQKVGSPGDLTPHLEKHFPTSHLVKARAAASRKVPAQKDILPPQPLSPAIEFFAEEFAIRTVDGAMSWISQEIQEGTTIEELKSQFESNKLGRPEDSFPTPETTSEEEDAADSSEKGQVKPSQQVSTPAELVFRKIVVEGSEAEEDSPQTESPEDDSSEGADKVVPRVIETTRVSSVAGCITYHIEHEIEGEESEHQVEEDTEDDDSGKDITQNDIGSASLVRKDIFVFESQQVENFAERVISKAVTEAVTSVLTTDSESDLSDFEKSPAYSRKNVSSAKGQEAAKATPARLADDSQKESLQLLSSDTSTYSSTASLEDSSDHTLIYQKSFQLLSSDTSTYGSTVSLEDTVEDISDKTLVSSPEVEMLADSVVSVAIKEAFRDASKAEPVGELPERTEPDGEHQPYAGPSFAVASTGLQQQPHKTSCVVDEDSDTGMTDDELDIDNDSTSLLTPPPVQESSDDVHQVNEEDEARACRDVMLPETASVPSITAEDAADIDNTKKEELPDAELTPIVALDPLLQGYEPPVSEVSEMTSEGASSTVVADLPELKQDREEALPSEQVEASFGPGHEDAMQERSSISSHEGTSDDKTEVHVQQVVHVLDDDEATVPVADTSFDSANQNLYPEVVKITHTSEDDKEPVEQDIIAMDDGHVVNNNDIVPADAVIHALDHIEALMTDKSDHEETSEEPDTVTWVDSIEEEDLPEDEEKTTAAPSSEDADDSHHKAGVFEQSDKRKKGLETEDVLEWQPFVSAATSEDQLEKNDLPLPVDSSTPNGHKVPTAAAALVSVDKVLAEDERAYPILPMSTDRAPVPQEQTDDDRYMSAASSGEDIDRWTKVLEYKPEGLSDESEVQTSQPDSEDDQATTSTEDTGEGLAYQGFTSPEAMSTGTTPTPTSPFFQEPGTSDQQPSLFEQQSDALDIDTLETYKTQLPEDEQASSNETEEDDSASSFSASSTDSEEYSEHDALVERSMMVSRSQSEQILPASKRPRTSDWGRQQSLESAGISAAEPIGERSRSLPRNVAMDNDDMDEDTPKQKVGTEQPLDVVCAPCPVQHGSVSFEEAELHQPKFTHQSNAPEKTQTEESGLFVTEGSLLHDDSIDKSTTLMHAGHEAGIECAVSSSVFHGDLPSSVSVSDFELPSSDVPSHPELALPGRPATSFLVDRESMVSDTSFPQSTTPEQTPPGVSPVLLQNTTKLAEHKAPVSASNHQLSDSLSLCGPRQVDEARSSTDAKLNDTANVLATEQASPLMDLPTLQPQDHSTHLYEEQETGITTDDLSQSATTKQTEKTNLPSVAYKPNTLPNSELYAANSAPDENIVTSSDTGDTATGYAPSTESNFMISPYDYQSTLTDLPTNSSSYGNQQAEMYQQMTGHVRTSSFEEELVGSYPSLPVKTKEFVSPAATALPSGLQGASEENSDRRKITLPMYYSQESDTLPSVESVDGSGEGEKNRVTGQWQEHLSEARQTAISPAHQPSYHDHQLLEQTGNNYVVDVESPNNPQPYSHTLEPELNSHPHSTQQTVPRREATSATSQPEMESLHIEVSSVASLIHPSSGQAVSSDNNTVWGTSVGDEYLLKTELADGVQFQQMRQNTTDLSPSPLNVFDLDPNDNDLRVLRETQESLDRVLAETGSLSPVSSTDEVRSSDSELMALMAELDEEEFLENVGKSTSFTALLDQPLSSNSSDDDWPHSVSLPSVRERELSPVRPLIVVSIPSQVDPQQTPSLDNSALSQNTTVSALDNQPRVSANFSTFEPAENTAEQPNFIPHDDDSVDVFALPSDHIIDSSPEDPQTQDTVVLRRKPKESKETKAETAAKRVSFSDEVDILQLSSQSLASETNEPVFTSPVVTTTAVKKLDSPVSTIELKSILKPDSSPQGKLLPGAGAEIYQDAAAKERITFYPSDTSGFKTPIDSPKLKRSNPRKPGSTCSEGNLDNLDSILTSYTAATGGKSSSMDNDINALTRPLTTPLQAYAVRVKKAKGESSSSEDSEVEYVVDTDPDLEQESPEDIEPNDLIRETDSPSQTLNLENSDSQMYKEVSTTASHRQQRSPQQSTQSPNQYGGDYDYTRTQDAVSDQLNRGQYSTSSPAPTSEIIYDLDKPVFQPGLPSSPGGVTETISQQVSSDMEGSMYPRITTTNLQSESALNLRNAAVCQETQLRQQQMEQDNRDAVSPGQSAEYRDTDNLSQLLLDTSDVSNNSGQSSDSTNTAELFRAAEDLVGDFEDTETFPGTSSSLSPSQGTVDRGSLHLNLESSSQSSSNTSVSTLVERRVHAKSHSSETVSMDTRYDAARGMDRETVGLGSPVKITKDMQTGDDDNLQPLRVITPSKFQKTVSTADEDQVHRSSGKSLSLPSLGPSPPLRAWDIFRQRYEQKRNTREKAIGTDDREMRSEAVGTDDRELLLKNAATGMDDLPERPTRSETTEADWSLEYEHLSGISLGTTFSTEHSTEYPEEEGPGEYHVTTEPEYAENGLSEVTSGYGSELNLHAADTIRRHREASQKDMTRQKCSEYIQRQEGYSDETSSNEESEDASLNSPTRQPEGLLIEASDLDTSPSVSPMYLSPDGERGKKHVSWSPEPQVIISQQSGGSQSTDSLLDENPLCPTSPEISFSSRSDSRTDYTASASNVRSSTPARNSVQPTLEGSPQFRDAGMSVHLNSLLEKSAHSDSFTQTDSFSSQSLNLSLSSSGSSSDFYTKENQLQNLKHERDSIMAYFGRDLSRQELTVELAEAKINYGIGETDAMLRMLQFGLPLDHPLAEVYMKEKEKKAFERVRSRSASPVRNISPSRTPGGLRSGSASPEKYSSPTAHLRASLSPQEASAASPQKHNQIDELLMEYQRARHHADMEINKARQKLRERTESERRRLQQEMEHLRTVEKEKLSTVKNVERAVVEEKKSLLKWQKPARTPGETEGEKTNRQIPWQLDEPPTHDSPQSPILDQHIDAEIQQLRQQYTVLSSIKTDKTPHPEKPRPQRHLAPRQVQRQNSDTSSVSSTTSSVSRCVDEHYTKTEEILTSAAAQLQRIRERAKRAVLMGQPASDESLQGARGRSPTARVTPSSLHPNLRTRAAAPHRREETTPKDFQFSQSLQKIQQAYPRYAPPTDPAAPHGGRVVYPSDVDSVSDISSAPYLSDDTLSIASTEHSLAWDNYGNTADSIVTRDQPQYHTAEDFYAKFRRKDTTHTATHSEHTSSRVLVHETAARFSQQNKDLSPTRMRDVSLLQPSQAGTESSLLTRAGLMDPEQPARETQAGGRRGLREETPSRTRDYVAGLETRTREDTPVELERYTPPKRVSVETWDEMDRHYQERVERQRNNLLKGTTRPTPQDNPEVTISPSQEPGSTQPQDLTSLGPQLTSHVLSEVYQVLGGAGGFSRPRSAGGWIFQSEEKDVVIYRKILDNSPIHCFLGVGLIAAPVGIVWGVVRDLNTRRHYDRTLKDIRTVATLGRGARIVHSVHETSQCFLQQPRDFCCLLQEGSQGGRYILAAQSVSHPSCPLTAGVTRGHLSQCGLVLEPVVQGNKEVTRVAYLIQVDLGSSVLPQLVNLASRKQPHLITYLSNYISPHT